MNRVNTLLVMAMALASLVISTEGVCQCTNSGGVRFNDDAQPYGTYGFPAGVHCINGPGASGGCATFCTNNLSGAVICATCCACCCGGDAANTPVGFVGQCPQPTND